MTNVTKNCMEKIFNSLGLGSFFPGLGHTRKMEGGKNGENPRRVIIYPANNVLDVKRNKAMTENLFSLDQR